jgi:hypothetical protein
MAQTHSEAEFQRMLHGYSMIERCSRDMLIAARMADWPRVAQLFEDCAQTLREVRRLNQTLTLSRDERKAKLKVIRLIIRNEAQIRRLASPWSDRYEYLMPGTVATFETTGLVV